MRVSRTFLLACAVVATSQVQHAARAAEYVVHLVTEGAHGRFMFDPPVLFAQPGDTIRFVPDDAMHAATASSWTSPVCMA